MFQRARCHRLLAQALWVIGLFADMPGEIEASFRLLGGREQWVRSRYGLLATQLAVQAWHLVAAPLTGQRQERRRERRLEMSHAASLLAMLRASPRDAVALLADSLLTLNLAEQAGSTNVVALGLLGGICLLAWLALRIFVQTAVAFVLVLMTPIALWKRLTT